VPQRNDTNPEIYDFAQTLNEELKRITHKGRRNRQNLNIQQQKALKKLAKRQDFILKSADKGAGVILLSPSQYEEEAYRQLHDATTYKKVQDTIMSEIKYRILDSINTQVMVGALPNKCAELLIVNNTKPGRFYLLPKIHKDIMNLPGRPIVSANQHPTEK
jgi:hypothetical protein